MARDMKLSDLQYRVVDAVERERPQYLHTESSIVERERVSVWMCSEPSISRERGYN